jgi:DNA ligase-4
MGEDMDAGQYDEDQIFYHLVFYLDTAVNAAKNGLAPSAPQPDVGER